MYRYIKSIFDFLFAAVLLLILSPLLIFLFLLQLVFMGARPLYYQTRPGRNEKLFVLIKFRTLKVDEYDESITFFGELMRKLSLDELPQLINVLKGEMSFIGPRPLLVEYLEFYNKAQQKRHLVKPGITGWAQVNGRNTLTWQKSLELDSYYAENYGFLLDFKILCLTFLQWFKFSEVNQNNKQTRSRFTGNHS